MNPIDKIKKRLTGNKWDLPEDYVRDAVTLLTEIDRLQKENDRLKTELAAATLNELPF